MNTDIEYVTFRMIGVDPDKPWIIKDHLFSALINKDGDFLLASAGYHNNEQPRPFEPQQIIKRKLGKIEFRSEWNGKVWFPRQVNE